MKYFIVIILAMFAVVMLLGCTEKQPLAVSVSDLNHNPEGYAWKSIRVHGILIDSNVSGFEEYFLTDGNFRIPLGNQVGKAGEKITLVGGWSLDHRYNPPIYTLNQYMPN